MALFLTMLALAALPLLPGLAPGLASHLGAWAHAAYAQWAAHVDAATATSTAATATATAPGAEGGVYALARFALVYGIAASLGASLARARGLLAGALGVLFLVKCGLATTRRLGV